MIEEIRIEWRFLGGWKVRRAATSGSNEISRTADAIVDFTNRVAKLDSLLDPGSARALPSDAAFGEFERDYDAVRENFEKIKGEFTSASSTQGPSSSWREIDDLLAVPMIPSPVRKRLVELAVARSLEDALQPRLRASQAADAKADLKPADGKADAKPIDGKADVKPADGRSEAKPTESLTDPTPSRDRASGADASLEIDDEPEPQVAADPAFWAQARGMALLEWSVLSIADVEGMLPAGPKAREGNGPLDQLEQEITSAGQLDWKSDPTKAYESSRDRISARIRNLRSAVCATCTTRSSGLGEMEAVWDENHRNRLDLQHALLALPLPLVDLVDARVKNPRFAKLSVDLAVFHLRALLLRHARRLADDLDTNRANILLKMAGSMGNENPEFLKIRQIVETLQVAKIKVSAASVVLDGDTHQTKIEVWIEPDRQIPQGHAVVSFAPFPKKDLEILRDDVRSAAIDVTLGARAPVVPEGPPVKVSYLVQRGIDVEDREGVVLNRDHTEKTVAASLYYRGHTFQTAPPIKIVIEPLKDVVYVSMRQVRQTIPKGFRDQFRRHPFDGYMHYNEELKYEIVLTNLTDENQELFFDYKLERDPESERHQPVKLEPKEFRVIVSDWVRGVDMKELGQKVLKSHEVDLGRPRHLDIDVWDGPARSRRLAPTKRFRFNHLDVDAEYAALMDNSWDPGDGLVKIVVRHLGADPGKGYIDDV